ncbi:MAG TPA: hypothetical protein VFE12_04585, partial [Acetobacteraceae bacterium]|nr:hypothetical protein [Acetobacteraceae bacterium]
MPPSAGPAGGGFAGANSSGGYSASVPLDLPPARGGLPVPVQIRYSERGVGAAGRGWDVPLSYIRRDTTIVRRRPLGTANVAPQGREQVSLVLDGQPVELVATSTGWSARRDDPGLQVRDQGSGNWVAYDSQGRTYLFAAAPALAGTGISLLQDVTGVGGSRVHLDYSITTPTVSGNPAIAIDLTRVSYNPHLTVAGCFKNAVSLIYDGDGAPMSVAVLGGATLVRTHKLTEVDVLGKDSCTTGDVRLRRYQLQY